MGFDLIEESVAIRPIQGYILVKALPVPETKPNGMIIIPEKHRITACEGLVLAVGPGKLDKKARVVVPMPEPVQPGSFIIYDSYAVIDITYGGQAFVMVHQDAILAIRTGAPDTVGVEDITSTCERYFGKEFVRETLNELKREQQDFVEESLESHEQSKQPREKLDIEDMKKFQQEGFNAPLREV